MKQPDREDTTPTCDICQAEKAEARAEIRRLLAAGVAREVLGDAAFKALAKDTHNTDEHPRGRVTDDRD